LYHRKENDSHKLLSYHPSHQHDITILRWAVSKFLFVVAVGRWWSQDIESEINDIPQLGNVKDAYTRIRFPRINRMAHLKRTQSIAQLSIINIAVR